MTNSQAPQPAHTPGPWHWEDGEEFNNMPHLMAGEAVVCHFGDDTRYYPTEGTPPSNEDKRLIAAAPELLAALQEAADYTRHPDYDWPVEFSRQVRDLIAKATGAKA